MTGVYAFWLEYTFNRTFGGGQGWPECFQLFWPHGAKPGRMTSQVHQHHAWRSWRQKRPQAPELILEIPAAWWRRSDERTYRTLGAKRVTASVFAETGSRAEVAVSSCSHARFGILGWRCGREAESRSHCHQVGERVSFHLPHDTASVCLHRDLANAKVAPDLLVQKACDHQCHNLLFAWGE